MTIFLHEIKYNLKMLFIWTLTISSMVFLCMMIYPSMKVEVDSLNELFANMGDFSAAFGLDKLHFGDAIGFYGVECCNILGIGGGLFAAILGTGILSKEEAERTAEFLLTHPISRFTIVLNKFFSVIVQILIMNLTVMGVSLFSFKIIGENAPMREIILLHFAYFILNVELASICFCISSFLKHNGTGTGIGVAVVLYFMNIMSNISEKAKGFNYITPFAYAEASDIISSSSLDDTLLLLGIIYSFAGVLFGTYFYCSKDITA